MFDLHVHTCYSSDGKETPVTIVKYLKKKGFNGMAVVDHHTINGALNAMNIKDDFLIIPGVEINTKKGHILALGVKEEIRSVEPMEMIEEIHDKGGISVLAHPYRFSIPQLKTDAVEALNGRNFPSQNIKAISYVESNNLPYTAGSDGHNLWEMGTSYTLMNAETVDESLDAILKRKIEVKGNHSMWHPVKCQLSSLKSFVFRGCVRV